LAAAGVDGLPTLQRAGPRDIRRLQQNRLQALSSVRYRSQCGGAKDRAHLAIAKIEQRLITRRGRFYKPQGMLWRTFHRLCDH
jgi:hypothetical protein